MKELLNALTDQIIGAAITVHHELGPGMLETAYEACLAFELIDRGLGVERQKALPLTYLIDNKGRVAATYVGVVERSNLETNVKALLAEAR